MNYDWECPDCKKVTLCSTTDDDIENYEELECPWCGRVSKIVDHEVTFIVQQTNKKASPTELEKLEALKKDHEKKG